MGTPAPDPSLAARLCLVRDPHPQRAVAQALAVRRAGGVPLFGDHRWSPDHWRQLYERYHGQPMPPGAAWATFTSGSTGSSRIVVRTHQSWADSFDALDRLAGLEGHQTWYLPLSLLSSMTTFTIAHAMARHDALHLPDHPAVHPRDLPHVTAAHLTPYALGAVVHAVESGSPSTLATVIVGGADLDPRLRARAEALGIRIIHYYGAAELSLVAVDPDGHGLRPFPGVEVRAVADGALAPGLGVLESRSPYGALAVLGEGGSWHRDAEGWQGVGDLVETAALPTLVLRGRRDGAILSAGATVVPHDVESVLRRAPGVAEAIAFGIPDPVVGELVGVAIEPRPGAHPTTGELRALARAHLPRSHRPRRWFLTDPMSRVASGKPSRTLLRDRALAGEVPGLD